MANLAKGLWFIDKNPKYCDFCDGKKECATIGTFNNDVIIVCKDCLQEFINEFREDGN
jgi:hypothetical protein